MNKLLFNIIKGLCLCHCFYFELAIFYFSEASALLQPLMDANKHEETEKTSLKKEKDFKRKDKTPESIYKLLN